MKINSVAAIISVMIFGGIFLITFGEWKIYTDYGWVIFTIGVFLLFADVIRQIETYSLKKRHILSDNNQIKIKEVK